MPEPMPFPDRDPAEQERDNALQIEHARQAAERAQAFENARRVELARQTEERAQALESARQIELDRQAAEQAQARIESESARQEAEREQARRESESARQEIERATAADLARYQVVLDATDKLLLPGDPGAMRVWIGATNTPAPPSVIGNARASALVPAVGQKSVQVKPFANGITFDPDIGPCQTLDREGTVSRFVMTPERTGSFEVNADVFLYLDPDCSSTPVPRQATTLSVTVEANPGKTVWLHLLELWDILWDGIKEFWGWLVGFMFAGLALYIRKRFNRSVPDDT